MHISVIARKLERIILVLMGILFPWSIMSATPQLHVGYWGQVEGMIIFSHFCSAIVALLLLKMGIKNKEIRQYFVHPIVLLPGLIGLYSIISGLFQMLPVLAFYGSPQLGQGAFGYFSLCLFTVLYFHLFKSSKLKFLLLINILLVTVVITIGSFYPYLTGIVISFFGFYDWLALYFTACIIFILHLIGTKKFIINKEILSLIFFLTLGPLFWIVDNNSSIALWIIILLAWISWHIIFYFKIKVKIFNILIFNPIFFTLIPIVLSIIMLISSYIFWDGKTDMTSQITNNATWGHLATLVARGSIVRVLFEHLDSIKVLLFGFGWGSISELLLKSFTPEVFYQINTGNRVHFHTHNELFEHIFSVGLVGASLYIMYVYNIFKYSFRNSIANSFLWLLYFCIGAFWFQWISIIAVQAMLAALLICNYSQNISYLFSDKVGRLFNSIYFYTFIMLFLSIFLFYGAYIGSYTAYNNTQYRDATSLIKIAEESKITGNCSKAVYDFGKGGYQFSQKYNGFNNYYKDQVFIQGKVSETDTMVLDWYICAADELIVSKKASIELINVHVNVLSSISILPGKIGEKTRNYSKKYMDLWEVRLMHLMSLAPKRVNQATPLISYYLNNENDDGVKRICTFFDNSNFYQGFCDLALGAVFIKEGNMDKGIYLIKRANANGVLDSKYIDPDTAEHLKKTINE